MEQLSESSSTSPPSRRRFLQTSSAALAGSSLMASAPRLGAQGNLNSKLRILQIGTGGIGSLDRGELAKHPKAEFVGFCDINSKVLQAIKVEHRDAFTEQDYREAFARHGDRFDAVLIDTPDFHHAPMILTALEHRKHIYGQKPLVHQLDELRLVREGLKKRPDLVTQMGNQRASVEGRMQVVEMLRGNQLGRPLEAHVWTGRLERDSHFASPWSPKPEPQPVPEHVAWDLWNGPLTEPFAFNADELYPRRWRAYWDTGSGQLGDWGCHLMDVLYYAYDLGSPEAVQTNTIRAATTGHSAHNQSTLTFAGGKRFARDKFIVHYNDHMIRPSFASLGMPAMKPGVNYTLIVCEEGTILLGDLGRIQVFRGGKLVENEPLPDVPEHNQWHDWIDRCLGKGVRHWSPFEVALKITEGTLLTVKATRFPRTELRWDGNAYQFTNHGSANETILKREYREGFAPQVVS